MIKPPLFTLSVIGLMALSPLLAAAADVQTTAEQEKVRRQANVEVADAALLEGDNQFRLRNYDQAVLQYQKACDTLADAPLNHGLRATALESFGRASVRLAEQRITEGRFEDAKAAASAVLAPQYNPNYKPAIQLLANLEDQDYYDTSRGPKFEDKVHEVQRLFIEAKGFYDSARFDLALKRYDQILDLDPYNIAARKGQEMVLAAKSRYANEAYNETRSLLTWQVVDKWGTQPRKYINREAVKIDTTNNSNSTEYIQNKLNHIIIPSLNFHDATVRDAIEFLHKKSVDLDTLETDPTRKGVNIVLKLDMTPGASAADANAIPGTVPAAPAATGGVSPGDTKITLSLTNIPLAEALRYICNLADLKVKIDPYAVTIVPISENTSSFITKEYKVPPGFLTAQAASAPSALSAIPGGATPGGGVGSPIATSAVATRMTALDYLKNAGVQFPDGASAQFLPSSSKLVVRNTEDNMDLVDQIVEALNAAQPTQVSVEAKFVEIQQTNYKELSFDYSLGQGNIGKIAYSGGNTAAPVITFPFTNIYNGGEIGSDLRSGGEAIQGNTIDALLNPSATAGQAQPATFALAGVVTPVQFQAIYRALNQRKGVDLLSAPSVTTKSGQRAVISVVVEFRYPEDFDPPKVPNIVLGGGGGAYTPVTPTTPTTFTMRPTGVTLEVEPVVGPDGETIDLNLSPEVVEFDGFINYGSPIYGPPVPIYSPLPFFGGDFFVFVDDLLEFPIVGYGPAQVITPNTINQPIFDTRKVTTSVSVWDGQTVIIGGLVREDVQTVQDKIPGLGDLPYIGRLFRSNVDQHIKRNLVMFVTARLMNPAGDAVHSEDEREEDVTPSGPPELPSTLALPEVPMSK